MPQISKVERDHDIKQVSRLEDLKPATEKSVSKTTPQIRGKPEIMDSSQTLTASMNAARRASIAAFRHAKTISDSSGKNEDQEAIDKMEASARNAMTDAADAALDAKDSLKRRIKKKSPDIKNTKDIKSNVRTIRKADRAIKSSTEATAIAAKTANQAAKEAAIASTKVASAKKAERLAKKTAEWVKKIVKGIIDAVKRLCAAIGAASVPLMLILVLAGAIAALVASAFGIFFSGDKANTGTRPLREVVLEINSEYTGKIENIKNTVAHDELVMEGYQASWPEVLSVYAVYVTTKTDGATDVVHITDDHVTFLKNIFWQMNTVTYSTKKVTETKKVPDLDSDGNQKKDKDGNLLYKDETVTKTILTITISHKTAAEEASSLHFNAQQLAQLNELLDVKNASLWAQILKGVGLGSSELVNLALSQLGNKGGEKYWRWAGLSKRCEWCALFVSWCGDQTGLRAAGQIPYFSFVSDGVKFYKNKGKWIDGSEVNSSNYDKLIQPGMIIFFDWEPDGKPNHVGIITKVENGYIYTVEGNSNDAVREKQYSANSNKIYGFGVVG
jgi:cell wall-associated NlpC family hydrolase